MALRILTAKEIGARVAEVMERAGIRSVAGSLAMGKDKQFLSRWTTGRRKRIDRDELLTIANYAEGRKDFADTDARTIMAYLDGEFDDWGIRLRPNLRLVGEDQPLDSPLPRTTKGRPLTLPAYLTDRIPA